MELHLLFRLVVLISSMVGFVLCFVSLVLPYWIYINTSAVTGYQGLFITCIENHGGDTSCSKVLDSNVNENYKVSQVFMCMGFAFYTIFIVLATLTFFWTNNWKKDRGIKIGGSVFAGLAVVCLIVTVVIFKRNHTDETVSVTYGWYLATISLSFAAIAVPWYAAEACKAVKKKEKTTKSYNVAPRPTAITEYQRQRFINDFSDQISKHQSKLPTLLGLKQAIPKLYDGAQDDHPPPRPVTPIGGDEDNLEPISLDIVKAPMIVPAMQEYKYKSLYDEDDMKFVHPPPKLISADVSVKDIFNKNLKHVYDSDTGSLQSSYSLGGGQLDDSDLEIYNITKGYTSNYSDDDRPKSHEAFGKKKLKKRHKVTPKVVDGKTVTRIEHEGLPTIKVIGPDRETSDYQNNTYRGSASSLVHRDNDILLPSAVKEQPSYMKAPSSVRVSRRQLHQYDKDSYAKSDDEIYTAKYGAKSPYTKQPDKTHEQVNANIQTSKKHKKRKSSKKRDRSIAGVENEGYKIVTPEQDTINDIDISNQSASKNQNIAVEIEQTQHDKDQIKNSDSVDDRQRSSKKKKRRKNKGEEETRDQPENSKDVEDKKRKSKKKRHRPYTGTDFTYDRVGETDLAYDKISGYGPDNGNENDTEPDSAGHVQSRLSRDESLKQAVDEILSIPVNEETHQTKL